VSFAWRAVLGTIMVLLLAMLVVVWAADRTLRRDLEQQTMEDLERIARLVNVSIADDPSGWQRHVRDLGQRNDLRITLINTAGEVVADSDIPNPTITDIANHADRPEVQAALSGELGTARRHSETVGAELFYVAIPGGPGVVRVASSRTQLDAVRSRSRTAIVWAAFLAIIVGSTVTVIAVSSITRPLRNLSAAARAIAAGNLPRFPRSGVPDIDGLVVSLRAMHGQLEERFDELRREQAESDAVVSAMVEGVLATDERGRIVTANPSARKQLGYGATDPIPDLPTLFKSRDARALVEAVMKGQAISREIEVDGITFFIGARPLPSGGAVVVLHDLTDLRKLETVRTDFVANVSHELKTPLTSVAGYTDTLLTDPPEPDMARQFLETIRSNTQRMQHLVDDLLDLSRIESGRWQPLPEEFSAAEVVQEEWDGLAPKAGPERTLVLDCDEDQRLRVDSAAFRQILVNLFDNAIRHTEATGTIRCDIHPSDGLIRVSIRDDGTGILSEQLPRIFERFYRADEARSRAQGGTGLGLAIVKHLVEGHGGRVEARSEWGVGTEIICWFPA
jgi:two-component system phosphate regulon sensor histidine kinase PhoR